MEVLSPCTGHISCLMTDDGIGFVIEQVKPALLVLRQLIHSEDKDVLGDACWALSYLSHSNGDNSNIQAVIETGACSRLVELLR